MARILFVPFDQLNSSHGVLKNANKKEDIVLLVEQKRTLSKTTLHREKQYFLISSARHFSEDLKKKGFKTEYLISESFAEAFETIRKKYPQHDLCAASPNSFGAQEQMLKNKVNLLPNDFFLTSKDEFQAWATRQKKFTMENFYRLQRVKFNALMDGDDPVGGRWNYDAENRLPPPKNYSWPPYLEHKPDEIDKQVAEELNHQPSGIWATTRKGALAQLEYFLKHHLKNFGPYEDAVTTDNWALHHSLLSPYLNNGLLHPQEVLDATLARFNEGDIPIESAEAFIRQLIGWREYVHGMYWFLGREYRDENQLRANRKLDEFFWDSSQTDLNCLKQTISDIEERAWTHHIPRLMILSNYALLTGIKPMEFLNWMKDVYVDATDWVMVPNVIGMGLHADGGRMMTKPYAAGGAYISRMTNYCGGCKYNPKLRVGENACPFTTLYWDFLDRHREVFSKNHRMAQQVRGLDRLSDLPELRIQAKKWLD